MAGAAKTRCRMQTGSAACAYHVGKSFHVGKVGSAGPLAMNSRIRFSASALCVARLRSHHGCVIHGPTGLDGRLRVVTTGVSRYLLMIAVGGPIARAAFVSHFLIATRTCHVPAAVLFGGVSLLSRSRLRCLSTVRRLCHSVKCGALHLSTGARFKVSRLRTSLGGGVALLSNGSNMNGDAVLGLVVPSTSTEVNRVSGSRRGNVRAAAFSRVCSVSRASRVVSAPKVGNFNVIGVRHSRVTRCFPRVFRVDGSYHFGGYARARRPNYTILSTLHGRRVDRDQCGDCLDVYSSLARKGCHWAVSL